MKTWKIQSKLKKVDDLIDLLLENRGIKTKKQKNEFLYPKLEDITTESVGINKNQLTKSLKRIEKAIKNQEQIIVYGDYDVDGITGAAILWETLHALGAKVMPYIPHRIDEGYGLSELGIKNLELRIKDTKLIITVDNGIVAHEAVEFANKQGIDVIITDHHVPDENPPDAHSIVHTTQLCGAGVAYLLAQELKTQNSKLKNKSQIPNTKYEILNTHLELAALGTIADMVPLTDANRTIVKFGLEKLGTTKRPGLLELYKQAGLEKQTFTPYEVGYIIAPRLNASGRIDSAMDSLRLLCTKNETRAEELAAKLELTNRERQQILKEATEHAIAGVQSSEFRVQNLLFIGSENYQQGVIGLVAGKLVEKFYRPAIVLSIGETHTKASARSVKGFNLIEFLRSHTDHFVNVGGHPMAAGFTVETTKIEALRLALEKSASEILTEEILTRSLTIDCELDLKSINQDLYDTIQTLSPFGMSNPEPTFVSYGVEVKDFKLLGKDRNHLKLTLTRSHSGEQRDSRIDSGQVPIESGSRQVGARMTSEIEAIGFGMGEFAESLKPGSKIDIVYTIDNNTWNGNTKLQIKIKDINRYE